MKKLSLTTKTIIVSIACIILLELCVVVVSSYYVNQIKDGLVDEAIAYAEIQGHEVSEEIVRSLDDENATFISEVKDSSAIESFLKILLQNDDIKYAIVIDENGNVFTQQTSGEDIEVSVLRTDRDLKSIDLPIKKETEHIGDLVYYVSKKTIEQKSARISKQMIFLVAIITAMTLAVFVLLGKIFQHHIEIVKRTNQMDRMSYIGTIAAGLVHEIRNPLNAMNVNFDLVKEDIDEPTENSPQRVKSLIGRLQSEIQSLNRLLSNFLSFAIPSKSEKTEFNVKELLDETIEFFTPEFRKKNIICFKDYDGEEITIRADRNELRQVTMNIVINAIQAMDKEEKSLRFDAELTGDRSVRLSISDNGMGIAKPSLEKIFDIFYSTKPGGAGFGLAIAKRIVNGAKGKIRAESKPGEGTTFFIELPID